MIIDALKPLIESGLINESTKDAINEAWEVKLKEAKALIRTDIREEFAGRYEHDKEVMVNALDKMVNETLSTEINRVRKERNQVAENKIKIVKEMKAKANKFNTFLTRQLAEELSDFKKDRKLTESAVKKLERFVMKSLAEEITEFAEDKKNLAETKVKLVSEAKAKLNTLKNKFVSRSSKAVSEMVARALKNELSQLHEDIKVARQNSFGRKIFEAFSTEFTGTYLNENTEVRKLREELAKKAIELKESKKIAVQKANLVESAARQLQTLKSRQERQTVLNELLSPLDRSKKQVMENLLENIQTPKLRSAFDKYLPSVLNNRSTKRNLNEDLENKDLRSEATGNKNINVQTEPDNLIDLQRLAGLK